MDETQIKPSYQEFLITRLGSLESRAPLARRLRPGAGRTVVAHEAAEALLPPHDEVGRADDREIGVPQGRNGGPWYAHARGAVVGRPNGKNPTRGNVAGLCGEADDA